MVSGIGGSGIGPLQRVSKETSQVAVKPSQQATDGVVDLTNTAHADTQTELNTTADQANFLRIEVSGQDYFLDLQPLTPEQRQEVLDDLKELILDPSGEVSADFNPDDFFKLTDELNVFQVGEGKSEISFDGDVDQSQAVLDRSNEGDDIYFDFMNNDESSLDKEGASEHVGDKNKPAAWYNGFQIEGDQVSTYRSALDTRDVATPELTMDQYKEMLMNDFNFNGAIDQFKELGGQDAFVQAMQERFPDHHLGQDGLKALAENVWSYATTGADIWGTTNIAEMQGMLYELDPRIAHSSDTNTPMSGEEFKIAGMDSPLHLGDGLHGRATILTTRHLLAGVNIEKTEAPTLEMTSVVDKFDARDRFIVDGSGSTSFGTVSGAIQEAYGLDKVKQEGSFDHYNSTVNKDDNHRANQVYDFSQVLDESFSLLAPNGTEEEARAYADLFGLDEQEFDKIFKPGTDGRYQMNSEKLMKTIGDYATQSGNDHKEYGASGESSFKALLTTMLLDPDYSDEALAPYRDDPRDTRPRLNTFTDEPEQAPEYLQLVQAIAEHKNLDVRVVSVASRSLQNVEDLETGLTVTELNTFNPDEFQNGMELDSRVQGGDQETGKGMIFKWREDQKLITRYD